MGICVLSSHLNGLHYRIIISPIEEYIGAYIKEILALDGQILAERSALFGLCGPILAIGQLFSCKLAKMAIWAVISGDFWACYLAQFFRLLSRILSSFLKDLCLLRRFARVSSLYI